MLLGASVYAAEAPTVSGFVHAQTNYSKTDQHGDKGNLNFAVSDGAIYFQHGVGSANVMVDVPFATGTGSEALMLDPGSKGQAYVSSNTTHGFKWKLGQWDTPFGYEANDSVDRTFNTDGAVASAMPVVHRGMSVGVDASEMLGVELFVANGSKFLTNPSSVGANRDKVESGLNVAAKMDHMTLNIGGMYGRAVRKNHYGVFFNTKYTMNALTLGLEVDYLRDAAVVATSTPEKVMTALHLGYAMSDTMNVAFRGEYLKHKDADIWTFTAGPQVEIEKDVWLKTDYQARRDSNPYQLGTKGGMKIWSHTVAFGAVARF